MATKVSEILNRHPAVGLAVGVVRNGSLESFHAHGLADIASRTPITKDTVFRIASITKTFTAVAIMQLWEQGLIDLDSPANDYLRAYRLVPAKPAYRPATVRHLLTHTSGIGETVHPWRVFAPDFGETVEAGKRVPALEEYYHGGLRLDAEPGTRFTYGNHGPATLGQIVADVSGLPLDRYFREQIFDPLGMEHTDIERRERVLARLATGYRLGSQGPTALKDRDVITAGAAAIYSTPQDMARYVAALLGAGANQHGSMLQPATLETMFQPQYQPDPRIPGIGLTFFRANANGHRVVEHQGVLPGFNSQILAAPDDGIGIVAFTNGARQAVLWLAAETGRLLHQLLGLTEESIRTDIPHHPETWDDIRGWYQLDARLADFTARTMLGAGAEVFVRGGRPLLRILTPVPALYHGFELHPDDDKDPYAYRIDLSEFGLGTLRVLFGFDPTTGECTIYQDVMPLALRKRPATTNPRLWVTGALGALAGASAAIAVGRRRAARR